jgi:hypothetical protein
LTPTTVMHSILPVTIPPGNTRGFANVLFLKCRFAHPRGVNKESQFPIPETTFTNHYCTQTRIHRNFTSVNNSLRQDAFFLLLATQYLTLRAFMIDTKYVKKKSVECKWIFNNNRGFGGKHFAAGSRARPKASRV